MDLVTAELKGLSRRQRRGMTADRVALESDLFSQRLADIKLWICDALGEDVFSNVQAPRSVGGEEEEEGGGAACVRRANLPMDEASQGIIAALETGVVLCRLLECVLPGCCSGYVAQPKTPAACLENLHKFVEGCAQYGVEATFASLDLYETKNMKTVISCLNELGRRATKNGFKPAYKPFMSSSRQSGEQRLSADLSHPPAADRCEESPAVSGGDTEEAEEAKEVQEAKPADGESGGEDDGVEEGGNADNEAEEAAAEDEDLLESQGEDNVEDIREDGESEKEDAGEEEEEVSDTKEEAEEEKAEAAPAEGSQAENGEEGLEGSEALEEEDDEAESSEDTEEGGDEEADTEGDRSADAPVPPATPMDDAPLDVPDEEAPPTPSDGDAIVPPLEPPPPVPDEDDSAGEEDMLDLLLQMATSPRAVPQDESSGDVKEDEEAVRAKPMIPKKPEGLLSPRAQPAMDDKPLVPLKPAAASKPSIPKKPEALMSPRSKPPVPEKPPTPSRPQTPSRTATAEEYEAQIAALMEELEKERELRRAAEQEVKRLKTSQRNLRKQVSKSISISSSSVKKKMRSGSIKAAPGDDVLVMLEQQRKEREKEDAERKKLEDRRRSNLESKEQRQRLGVLHEILNTEKSYVDDLQFLGRVHDALDAEKVLTAPELSAIFSNVSQIRLIHEELTTTFHQRMEQSSVDEAWQLAVGDIFLRMADFLKMYTVYVSNQAKQTQVLESNLSHSRFNGCLIRNMPDRFDSKRKVATEMNSLLIKPIQRICKYPLLLRELIKCTDDNHPDKENLKKAMQQVESIAGFVNEKKKETETLLGLLRLQESISDLPKNFSVVTPTRRFIREATMVKISKGRAQERHFFLFNDLLLYCAKRAIGGRLTFKGKVPLNTLLVNDLPNTSERKYTFELVRMDHKKKKYIICAKDEEEKAEWMQGLNDLIQEILAEANDAHKGITKAPVSAYEAHLAALRETSEELEYLKTRLNPTEEQVEQMVVLDAKLRELKRSIGKDSESVVTAEEK